MEKFKSFYQRHIWIKPIYGLLLATTFSIFLFMLRFFMTHQLNHLYLVWNLFLAWIPLWLIILVRSREKKSGKNRPRLFFYLFMWLLFFPNAPYLITDFIHLKTEDLFLALYDGIMIFNFAFTGLGTGLLSLYWAQKMVKSYYNATLSHFFAYTCIILSGYGIFIGRILRWNSWDLFLNPIALFKDCLVYANDKVALVITFLFAMVIGTIYIIFRNLIYLKNEPHAN